MKIAIIGPAYPYRGGIANFSERLAFEFQNHQHEVHLYTYKMMYPDFIFPGKTQYAETPLQYPLTITRNINSINPFNWKKIGKEIKAKQYDLILAAYSIPFLGPSLGSICRIAKKNTNTKVISIIHNLNPHEKRIGDKTLSKYFLNSCTAHLALSNKVKEQIELIDSQHPTVFSPLPVYDSFGKTIPKNDALTQLNLDKNQQYILFFGLVRAYKGLDLLIDAMHIVQQKNNTIKLIIAGEFYADYDKYKQQIADNKLENQIIIYNKFIPEDEVNIYFGASDLVVQPYKNATQSAVTQVCYHFNKSMLVTNVGGLPEAVPHNIVGYVCEPNAPDIAKYILQFYTDNQIEIFEKNIAIEKEKFSWKTMMEKIKSLSL